MGYNQNDSQEMLQFALDGLHEDLNRVIDKPQVETKDSDGRPDLIVAEEHWNAFQMRNKSILVDLMYGQYKSRLVCPKCNKVSITFNSYQMVSLPIPQDKNKALEYIYVDPKQREAEIKCQFYYKKDGGATLKQLLEDVSAKF